MDELTFMTMRGLGRRAGAVFLRSERGVSEKGSVEKGSGMSLEDLETCSVLLE